MSLFVDTSALLAILDREDRYHLRAETAWQQFILSGTMLVTTSYIVVEATALLQRRISLSAVKVLVEEMLPVISIDWVNPAIHQEGVERLLVENRRNLSLSRLRQFCYHAPLEHHNSFRF